LDEKLQQYWYDVIWFWLEIILILLFIGYEVLSCLRNRSPS
jgi:hypothetical protein